MYASRGIQFMQKTLKTRAGYENSIFRTQNHIKFKTVEETISHQIFFQVHWILQHLIFKYIKLNAFCWYYFLFSTIDNLFTLQLRWVLIEIVNVNFVKLSGISLSLEFRFIWSVWQEETCVVLILISKTDWNVRLLNDVGMNYL